MRRNKLALHLIVALAAALSWGVGQGIRAQSQDTRQVPSRGAEERMKRMTNVERKAAAARRAAAAQGAAASQGAPGQVSRRVVPFGRANALGPVLDPGGIPDYFNIGNYANSPLPVLDASGAVVPGTGTRKFVDTLPGLGAAGCTVTPVNTCNANNLGQFIPIASPIAGRVGVPADGDYYEIGLYDYFQRMHSDLPTTKLRGYRDLAPAADGQNHYLGPLIIAQRDRPVRIKFINNLSLGAVGNLFIPVDTTAMGAGLGPDGVNSYTQNRAALHLHGGHTPWISDGTPHQWITPAGEAGPYLKGDSQQNVPDMFGGAPGAGSATYFWSNQQSGRLMFYHDHSYGITRLNVYAGEAAGYLIWDQAEEDLLSGTNVTGINTGLKKVIPDLGGVYHYGIPLIIQDKTFLPPSTTLAAGQRFSMENPTWGTTAGGQLAAQDPTWDTRPGKWGSAVGSLWFPHVYTPNQNPKDPGGANAFGRWDYGPWFWPPLTASAGLVHGEIVGTGANGCPVGVTCPGIPNPSMTPESFMDTPLVNGTAYPVLPVQRKAYRFRILNAGNDRTLNLQIYYVDPANPTEVKMVDAVPGRGLPATWPTDGRDGGVPDPETAGPSFIQIGTESGFLPAPVVIDPTPIGYEYGRRSITVLNMSTHGLLLGPAERADVIVDFSGVPDGSKLILYNDGPAPAPAFDSRLDYYTGDPDQTSMGGAPPTIAGYGPNTRTIMRFEVAVGGPVAPAFDLASLQALLPSAYNYDQPEPIVPQTANAGVAADTYSRIEDTTVGVAGVTYPLQPKTIQELFELNYGRMNATLGVEVPLTNFNTQTTIPYGYTDPPTESLQNGVPQLWKITHNGVDTHFIHFHLTDVQLINRVGWDGAVKPPDPNEVGWKETIRMNPLEDVIVALRPTTPTTPFVVPGHSTRFLDVTQPPGGTMGFSGVDPNNNPVVVTNVSTDFLWEYVWHCHILGHEENDMMRAIVFNPAARAAPFPTVATVLPTSGLAAGGAAITITGTNFAPNAQVWVGGVQATGVTVVSATRITATTPAGPAGLLADVAVTTPGVMDAPVMNGLAATADAGTGTLRSGFAYLAVPAVTGIIPATGPMEGGTSVTITGTHFIAGNTTVTIGGNAATSVGVISSTMLTAVAPAGGFGPAAVVVTTAGGSGTLAPPTFSYYATHLIPPVLASPIGNATAATNMPSMTWQAVPGAEQYYLWMVSGGQVIGAWYTGAVAGCPASTGTCSVTPPQALADGLTRWQVKAWSAALGHGPWSADGWFTVALPALVPPTLVSPIGNVTVATTQPTWSWQAVTGSEDYYVWYVNGGQVGGQWYTPAQANCPLGTGTCSVTATTPLAAGLTRWEVKAWNTPSGHGPWSSDGWFNIVPAFLPTPTLFAPIGNATVSTAQPTFSWKAITGAERYYLWVVNGGSVLGGWYSAASAGCGAGSGTCAVTLPNRLAGGLTRWQVQASSTVMGTSPWSADGWFSVAVASLSAPILMSPNGNPTLTTTLPSYSWQAVSGAEQYYLWVSGAGGVLGQWFSASSAGCGGGAGACTVTLPTALTPGLTRWQVKASSTAMGDGPWSADGWFTVPIGGGM